jgi:CHAT domain-containing protein
VLSACHAGQGTLASGEGLLSLTRSFLAAGADEVIASSWAVEDRATSELLTSTWRAITTGASPVDALRAAKLALRDTADPRGFSRAHPYFWASWSAQRGR